MEQNRGGFSSYFGFLMAIIGGAVGLGNIWGFPYKMGANGGFAFLLVYLIMAVFIGYACLMAEMAIGRKTQLSCGLAYSAIDKRFGFIGVLGVLSAFFILTFYFMLGGMVLRYACGYFFSFLDLDTFGDQMTFFGRFITNGGNMVTFDVIFIVLNVIVVVSGVNGIDKFNKYAMPALFVLLLVVLVFVACQPGAMEGYKYMFAWNIEPLKGDGFFQVAKTAAGQMFFSLSLAMSITVTYGSYLSKKENIQKSSVIIIIADTLVAILAGMVVLPACAAFDLDYAAGPGLLFSTMQIVFMKMGSIGNFIGFLFYVLVLIAAMSSSIAILEAIASMPIDKNLQKGKGGPTGNRKKITIIVAVAVFVVGLPAVLDALGSGIANGAAVSYPAELFNISVKGWNDCWLDFYDMISEGVLMPLGELFLAVVVGWIWKPTLVFNECEIEGNRVRGKGFLNVCYKIITPLGMCIVLWGQLMAFFG